MSQNSELESSPVKKFNAFNGVFIPIFLSILGVILYLRLGYVVGNAGIPWTIAIILLSVSITLSTGLSLSSITTNIRLGSGAAYSIISKTLGLEVGGSVGIPLYLAQDFSVALYLLGFAEAWQFSFPDHPFKIVALTAFLVLFGITLVSTSFVVRVQFIVFLVVLCALASIFLGGGGEWVQMVTTPAIAQGLPDREFWPLFALFFPAVTGLMAGIGLSGELKDPKKQIPKGVLSSLLITTLVYIAMVFKLGHSASSEALVENSLILVDLAAYGPLVLFGILCSTFSGALTIFVAAPRLMRALASNSIIPFSSFFVQSHKGEPRNAILFSSSIIFTFLLFGSLDSIAPVLTMFFLITYSMINLVVFIEQSLGLPSFRPTFRIPIIVPLYGALGSILCMFLISAPAGIIALIFLFATYVTLVKRNLVQDEGDVRSSLFRTLSEWAAKKVQNLPESTQHTWKPNILLPALDSATVLGNFPLMRAIAFPNGTMTVLGMKVHQKNSKPSKDYPGVEMSKKAQVYDMESLEVLVDKFGSEGIFTSSSLVDVDDYSKGIAIAIDAIESQVFHPNIIFLPFKPRQFTPQALQRIYDATLENSMSLVLFDRDEDTGLGSEQDIHVWISPDVLEQEFYDDREFDLALLLGYKLMKNWQGNLKLWMCVPESRTQDAQLYLEKLLYESRFPVHAEINVVNGNFYSNLEEAPHGDIHIISISDHGLEHISKIAKIKGKSFLFVSDSTREDVLA